MEAMKDENNRDIIFKDIFNLTNSKQLLSVEVFSDLENILMKYLNVMETFPDYNYIVLYMII